MTPLKQVRFNQEFHWQGEICHMPLRDAGRSRSGARQVLVRSRQGRDVWLDWDTPVQICEHSLDA